MSRHEARLTRRELASRAFLQDAAGRGPAPRLVARAELVNVLEYEAQAARVLPAPMAALLAGSDRAAFDRITIRPRMMIPAVDLDLTLTLFGASHFAPILVAPVSNQARFHREAEVATARGASAANATMIVSSQSSTPLKAIVGATTLPPWFQVFDGDPAAATAATAAVADGCRAVVVTLGARATADGSVTRTTPNWTAVSRLAASAGVPVIVKDVRTLEQASTAASSGAAAIVVSGYVDRGARTAAPTVLDLGGFVDRVGGKIPVLADGHYRRGTDILKALALGARAVLVGRPVMWGLAAYGSEGVQGVVEMLQTELARYMAMSGRLTLATVDRSLVTLHQR